MSAALKEKQLGHKENEAQGWSCYNFLKCEVEQEKNETVTKGEACLYELQICYLVLK